MSSTIVTKSSNSYGTWREVFCLGLVVALPLLSFPLSWLPPGQTQFRFMVTVPLAAVALVAVLLLCGRAILRPAPLRIPRSIAWPIIASVVSFLLSVRWSQHPYVSIGALPVALSNLAVFWGATQFSREQIARLMRGWTLVAAVVALNGLVRLGREQDFISTIGNRNFLAAYLAASAVIAGSMRDKRAWLSVPLLLAAMWFCKSRGAWLALGIVVVLWLLHQTISGGQKRWTFRALGTLVVIGSTAACLILRASLERQWREDVRPFLWKGTVQMIAARPVFGYGLGTFVIAYPPFRLPEYFLLRKATNVTDHPHNELLEIAAEQGMLGVAATLWLWSTAFWPGLRAVRKGGAPQQGHWGLLGAAIVLLVHGMLDVGLRYPPDQTLFWLLLGLLAGSGEAGARSQPKLLASSVARIGLAATCWLLAAWAVAQAVVQPLRADLWERRAHLAEADGDLVNASVAAEQSLEAEPFRLRVRYFLASVIARANTSKADERAIEVLKSLELIAPDYANIQYNLGSLYVRRGQFAEALPHLQRAVKTDPYKSDLHLSLAAALERLGQSAAAAQERAKAAALAEQGF